MNSKEAVSSKKQKEKENAESQPLGGARGSAVHTQGDDSDRRALSRFEWLQCLVRSAVQRYVRTKEVKDVSTAVDKMFADDIGPAMSGGPLWEEVGVLPLQDSNAFRNAACYRWETDDVLTEHLESLKAIFHGWAGSEKVPESPLQDATLSATEWMDFCTAVGLIDHEFTPREALLAFTWSRMRVIDEREKLSRLRLESLGLEDFFEALARVATMKALPTDDELVLCYVEGESPFDETPDAGEWLLWMRRQHAKAYKAWVSANGRRWDQPPREDYHRQLTHLIELVVRTIDGVAQGADDLKLTPKEVSLFRAMNSKKRGTRSASPMSKGGNG